MVDRVSAAASCAACAECSPAAPARPVALWGRGGIVYARSLHEIARLDATTGLAEFRRQTESHLAEVARAWIARTQMPQIDAALRQYYRKNIRFPDTFSAIEPSLPEPLRRDPWGQPWSYQPCAPEGLSKLTAQRYRLGPAAFPSLSPLAQALGDRNPAAPAWKIALHGSREARVLEFQSATGTHLLQPGGKIGDATLLYIGENWALLAWPDQLFAVTF